METIALFLQLVFVACEGESERQACIKKYMSCHETVQVQEIPKNTLHVRQFVACNKKEF